MKIGKRHMSFWSFLLWVGALGLWFAGPFFIIKGIHFSSEMEVAGWDIAGLILLSMLSGAVALFLLFQALASPPGQFRNIIFGIIAVGLVAGIAELVDFVQNVAFDLRGTLLDIAMVIVGGFVANAVGLFLDKGVE